MPGAHASASNVRGRTTVIDPYVIYLIDSYWLSNKRRGEVTTAYTIIEA